MSSVSHNEFFLFQASSVLVIKDNLKFTFTYLGVGSFFFICLCVCVFMYCFSILSLKHSDNTCWMVMGFRVSQAQQTQMLLNYWWNCFMKKSTGKRMGVISKFLSKYSFSRFNFSQFFVVVKFTFIRNPEVSSLLWKYAFY